jgi:hypothetical protein
MAGPMFIRSDLRLDLANDATPRMRPASPRMIIGTEIAAVLVVLAPIQWLALVSAPPPSRPSRIPRCPAPVVLQGRQGSYSIRITLKWQTWSREGPCSERESRR